MASFPPPSSLVTERFDDAELTVAFWGDGPAQIVLLHDGLGSISQWRGVPAGLAAATGRTVMAYDRPGHGRSTPVPTGPWPADWLHREADRLALLLAGTDRVAVEDPLLVGHSDGGSIGLLYAAALGGGALQGPSIRGLATLAAHSWVEQSCFDAIAGMRADATQIVAGLARSNAKPAALFEAWSGVWVSDQFRPWDVRPLLSAIAVPTLVVQGRDDEYASDQHAIETAGAVGPNADWRLLDNLGHLLHHQAPDQVIDVVAEFDSALSS